MQESHPSRELGKDPRILLASMPDQAIRRSFVRKNIGNSVPFEFVECVNGLGWSDEDVRKHMSPDFFARRERDLEAGKSWLASGAIACALTHRDNMMERITSTGKILCEDDVGFEKDFLAELQSKNWWNEMDQIDGPILLNYRSRKPISAESKSLFSFGRYSVHRSEAPELVSAAAYFLNPKTASEIRNFQTPLRAGVDAWCSMRRQGAFKHINLIHPMPTWIEPFPSTVNYSDRGIKGLGLVPKIERRLRAANRVFRSVVGLTHNRITHWQ